MASSSPLPNASHFPCTPPNRRSLTLAVIFSTAFSIGLIAAPSARANSTAEELGATSSVLGQMGRFAAEGADAVLFAPSLLVFAEDNLLMGMTFLWQRLSVDLDARPAGSDVSRSILTARVPDSSGGAASPMLKPLPTQQLVAARGAAGQDGSNGLFFFGTVKRFLDNRLAFGFYSILPMTQFQVQRPFFADEREQYFSNSLHFERYEDALQQNAFVFALAGAPFDWLALGVGVTFTNVTQVSNAIYMPDAGDQSTSNVNGKVEVNSRLVPHGSVTFVPLENLRLTASFHAESRSKVEGASRLQFWNFNYPDDQNYLLQTFEGSYGFSPMRMALGGWWQTGTSDLLWQVAAGATYNVWSNYIDHHGEAPVQEWSDTLTVSGGASLRMGQHRWGVDVRYDPSPVPEQDGRSNYVDNNRLGASFGYEFDFSLGASRFAALLQVQGAWLLDRSHTKSADSSYPVLDEFPDDAVNALTGQAIPEAAGLQSNNPGFPGYSHGGFTLDVALSMRMLF